MIGDHNFWKQSEPSSVAKINAEVKNVTRELNDIDADRLAFAARKYHKINKVSQKEASDILSQNPALIEEWANK